MEDPLHFLTARSLPGNFFINFRISTRLEAVSFQTDFILNSFLLHSQKGCLVCLHMPLSQPFPKSNNPKDCCQVILRLVITRQPRRIIKFECGPIRTLKSMSRHQNFNVLFWTPLIFFDVTSRYGFFQKILNEITGMRRCTILNENPIFSLIDLINGKK